MKISDSRFHIILLFLVSSIGFYWLTQENNLAINPDSVYYINAADNLTQGNGLTDNNGQLESHWPPFYPMVLSAISTVSGKSITSIGPFLHAILFGITILLFYLILSELHVTRSTGLLFSFALMFSKPLIVFGSYMSESIFYPSTFLMILLILKWISKKELKLLLLAGLIGGLMMVTRYASAGILFAVIAYIFVLNKWNWLKAIKQSCIFGFPILFIFTIWYAYASICGTSGTNRDFTFHMIAPYKILDFFTTLLSWFASNPFTYVILTCLLLLYVAQNYQSKNRFLQNISNQKQPVLFLSSIIIIYELFHVFVICFLDAQSPIDNRMAGPILPPLLCLIALVSAGKPLHKNSRINNVLRFAFIFLMLSSSFSQWVYLYEGGGYSHPKWKTSNTLKYVLQQQDKNFISNGVDLIALHAKNYTELLPKKIDPNSTLKNRHIKEDVEKIKAQINSGNTELAYFGMINWRWYLYKRKEIYRDFQEFECIYFNDGFIVLKQDSID
ncbi:MAG: hypothetical protein ACI8QQ_002674 [Psychroserpens sp.]|jgi:hypothetical protein